MKTILISGGSDGLGKAIAARLAPHHRVIIFSPSADKLRQTAEHIGCEYQVGDVRDYDRMAQIVRDVGPIDCLVNNAGLWIEGQLDALDPQKIREVIEVNTLGAIHLAQLVLPGMKQRQSGLILNVVSQAGLYARPERSVYNASKWALTGFTKSLQAELAPFGVAVTGLYPGKIKTGLFAHAGQDKDMSNGLEPDDVARTVEFLLSFDVPVTFPEIGIKHIAG